MGLLISDHRPYMFSDVADNFWAFNTDGVLNKTDSKPEKYAKDVCRKTDYNKGDAIITAQNLTVKTDAGRVWSDADFNIYPGEMVAVCGKNGSGKTTLMRCLMGAVMPESGEIKVFGQNSVPENLRGRVGFLFQDPSRQLFEDSVFKEVAFQVRRTGNRQWKEKVKFALARCGISHLLLCSPHKLSYGQQHLVAMAMVIAGEPELLLLDDPFTGLDLKIFEKMVHLLKQMRREINTTVIVTTHHPEDGLIYDRRLMIREGRIIEE
jgi:energy-coupling factor transporter ATP-binding protein EcfA2